MKQQNWNQENDFFTAKKIGAVMMLTFKKKRLVPVTLWSIKTPLFEYLDEVSKSDAVRVVVVKDQPSRHPCKEYLDFYDLIMKGEMDKNALWRMCTAYDQPISAHEVLDLGLVNEVIPREALENAVLKKAQYFAQKPASSLGGTKRLLNYSLKDLKEFLRFENHALVNIFRHKTGMKPSLF